MIHNFDSEGYRLVPLEFNSGGYTYKFVEQIDRDWRIYSTYSPTAKKIIDYELVRFVKSEEYTIAGNTVPKKWTYPTANMFGKHGFSCHCVEGCYRKHKEVLARAEEKAEPEAEIEIPRNKEFTVKELVKSLDLPYPKVYAKVREIESELTVVRLIKNKTGRDTKVYKYETK